MICSDSQLPFIPLLIQKKEQYCNFIEAPMAGGFFFLFSINFLLGMYHMYVQRYQYCVVTSTNVHMYMACECIAVKNNERADGNSTRTLARICTCTCTYGVQMYMRRFSDLQFHTYVCTDTYDTDTENVMIHTQVSYISYVGENWLQLASVQDALCDLP